VLHQNAEQLEAQRLDPVRLAWPLWVCRQNCVGQVHTIPPERKVSCVFQNSNFSQVVVVLVGWTLILILFTRCSPL